MVSPTVNPGWAWWKSFLALVCAAAVAPLLFACLGVVAGWLDPPAVLGSVTVAIFAGVVAIAAAASAGRRLVARDRAQAAAWLVVAMLAGEGVASWATRTSGTLAIGVGEDGAAWTVEHAPVIGGFPDVHLLELPASPFGEARLLVDAREVSLRIGDAAAVGSGRRLVVRGVAMAPAFTVRRANGSIEGAGLIKLVPGRRDWFEVGTLPHRFYVTLKEPPADTVDLTPPIHLRVQRGKLSVYEGDLGIGEVARVEGISIVFERGAPWARIEAGSHPTGVGALAALALAAITWVAERRRLRSRS